MAALPPTGPLDSPNKSNRARRISIRRHQLGGARPAGVRSPSPPPRCGWLSNPYALSSWQHAIYVVDNTSAPLHTAVNKGREAMAYLTYVIDNYDSSLADTVLFLHAHRDGELRAWHVDNEGHDNVEAVRALRLEYVAGAGYVNLRCGVSGIRRAFLLCRWIVLALRRVWELIRCLRLYKEMANPSPSHPSSSPAATTKSNPSAPPPSPASKSSTPCTTRGRSCSPARRSPPKSACRAARSSRSPRRRSGRGRRRTMSDTARGSSRPGSLIWRAGG